MPETVLNIGGREVGDGRPVFVIAEIGFNHNGSFPRGLELVDAAAAAGADCVKLQMRDLPTLYANGGNCNDIAEDLGSQYVLDNVTSSQLDPESIFRLMRRAEEHGMVAMCTPWDHESLRALEDFGVCAFKIASADLNNHPLLRSAAKTGKPLIVSTGMSTEVEIEAAAALLRRMNASFALLHCVSTYPPPFTDINLRYMQRLCSYAPLIGYSGHEKGISIALASVALGACIVEKHLTVDRQLPGVDHKISLLPDEFKALVGGIREIEEGLGDDRDRFLRHGEKLNRQSLAKSVVAARDLRPGELITEDSLMVRAPGKGLPPYALTRLLGKPVRRELSRGDFLYPSDFHNGWPSERPHSFEFLRPFGLPVRFHDYSSLAKKFEPDFLEFHLSYKDLEEFVSDHVSTPLPYSLSVHAPDQLAGDCYFDLAADNPAIQAASMHCVERVVEMARALAPFFRSAPTPTVVFNLGGFSFDGFFKEAERMKRYERIAEALLRADTSGLTVLAQTLPPFPWHFGGRRFGNLFVDPVETAWFAEHFDVRLCLDVSHTYLATNHLRTSFREAVEILAPHSRLFHLSDAAGFDGEGLQVGEGEIDFQDLANLLNENSPGIGFVPEPWQGHIDSGEGFRRALRRLERYFGVRQQEARQLSSHNIRHTATD